MKLKIDTLTGKKADTGKIPLDLLPKNALIEVAKVLQFGASKYSANNWRGGFKWTRLIAAAERHLFAFEEGQDTDPETGLSHIAHASCCLLFLLTHELEKLGTDDRHRSEAFDKKLNKLSDESKSEFDKLRDLVEKF